MEILNPPSNVLTRMFNSPTKRPTPHGSARAELPRQHNGGPKPHFESLFLKISVHCLSKRPGKNPAIRKPAKNRAASLPPTAFRPNFRRCRNSTMQPSYKTPDWSKTARSNSESAISGKQKSCAASQTKEVRRRRTSLRHHY